MVLSDTISLCDSDTCALVLLSSFPISEDIGNFDEADFVSLLHILTAPIVTCEVLDVTERRRFLSDDGSFGGSAFSFRITEAGREFGSLISFEVWTLSFSCSGKDVSGEDEVPGVEFDDDVIRDLETIGSDGFGPSSE